MRAMLLNPRTVTLAAAGMIIWSAGADAATDASGIWYDHNGRGAVEIAPCASGKGLCGYVVHIKDAKNASRCGTQILGNVTPNGGGWIYSPDRGKKYSVELTRLSDDKLRVVGNAGSFFSKTFTWKRAPDDVARCGETTAAAPTPAKPAETKTAAVETAPASEKVAAPSKTRSLGSSASSASMALMGAPKKSEVKPVAAPAEAVPETPAPVTKEAVPAKAEPATAKTADAPAPVEDTEEFVPERKCKFKIPYVGRVISVPCRD
jgi:uncharacterized protein (DUF2147 family)